MRLRTVLAVLVVVAAILTGFLATRDAPAVIKPAVAEDGTYRTGSLPDDDAEAAVEVAARVVPAALSYDFRTLDKGLADAMKLMTKSFAAEFKETFDKTARPLAMRKRAVTRAMVRGAGLVRMDGNDSATCLVYLDQLLVSSEDSESSTPPTIQQSRVIVLLRREGGTWKVDGIDPF